MKPPVIDPWRDLRPLTAARIGLQRAGASLATGPLLALRLAHARARDAVHAELDLAALQAAIGPVTAVDSAARSRDEYLLRPDLGRRLAEPLPLPAGAYDAAIVLADGLSARAVQDHAPAVLTALLPLLAGWRIAPRVVVRQGRVAVGDAVAIALGAASVLILIGERPGLSAPDSLGAYLTWHPDRPNHGCRPQLRLQHPARRDCPRGGRGEAGLAAAGDAAAGRLGCCSEG